MSLFVSDTVRAAYGLPESWEACVMTVIGDRHIKIDGAVYPRLKSGPRKGGTNYRQPEKGSERTIVLSMEEYRNMRLERRVDART